MFSVVSSIGVIGIEGYRVDVEVDVSRGLPSFNIVGLPDSSVKESKERVRSAIKNSGFQFPSGRVTVNLSPADVKKEGSSFDLPIAVGILIASGVVPKRSLDNLFFVGELSLDGGLRPVRGALSCAIFSRKVGGSLVVPDPSLREALLVDGIEVFPARNLSDVLGFLKGEKELKSSGSVVIGTSNSSYSVDFSEVKGQERIRRALEVAAAGGHNLLMVGPPGAGKTMMAQRFPTILPPMSREEIIETTMIHSVAGLLTEEKPFVLERPFVSPHHTSSDTGIIGGGQIPRPGAISIAHNGVLFMDELPEFKRTVLESLRQPLEEGKITISRASMTVTFPSRFILIAASNPCPCGYFGFEGKKVCTCSPSQIRKYQSRLSGPLMDRIDIHIEVPPLDAEELLGEGEGEPSSVIRERVVAARKIQEERFKGFSIRLNSQMDQKMLKRFCRLGEKERIFLKKAVEALGLSARSFSRVLKVARTIADLSGSPSIEIRHISEAVGYRVLDRRIA